MAMSRRDFVVSAAGLAACGVGGAAGRAMNSNEEDSRPAAGPPDHPVVLASGNGVAACERAMAMVRAGADPVDAVVAGVNVVEDDPNDHSVGLGGLPNEEGEVELDACVMHGPTHKGGGVASLRRIRNAASVAKLVMQRTDHVLLAGEGALHFAKAHGFKEEELLTDHARRAWLEWKERCSPKDNWVAPESGSDPVGGAGVPFTHGTITCMALTAAGDLGGCTSTSGRSYKLPGRVSDSPILGAGLYVDNAVGACGSTGRGEANLLNCSSFMVVELMRAGVAPEEACRRMLRRVAEKTEIRLRDDQGEPAYQLILYALRRDGVVGGACMRGQAEMAVHDGQSCRRVKLAGLFPNSARGGHS